MRLKMCASTALEVVENLEDERATGPQLANEDRVIVERQGDFKKCSWASRT